MMTLVYECNFCGEIFQSVPHDVECPNCGAGEDDVRVI